MAAAVRFAEVSFRVSMAPTTLLYPWRRSLTYEIQITTGAHAADIGLVAGGPSWPGPRVFGSPLSFGQARLEGPGSLTGFANGGSALDETACLRGALPGDGGVEAKIPAHSTSTVAWRASLDAPPWPHTDYDPRLVALLPFYSDHARQIPLRSESLRVGGLSGVHITLHARPRHGLRHGKPVTIVGSTDPNLRGQTLRLGYRRATPNGLAPLRPIATLRTNRHGHFSHHGWRAPRPGDYEILASYPHPRPGLVADTNCDLVLHAS